MLFFIFIVILIVGIVCLDIYQRPSTNSDSAFCEMGVALTILGCVAVLLSTIAIGVCHITAEARLDSLEVERASLVYQYENGFYDNDNDIGKKELMSEIQDFNTRLVKYKCYQRDPWIGIYIPNIYDDLEPIDISR